MGYISRTGGHAVRLEPRSISPAILALAFALLIPGPAASQSLPFHTPTGITAGFNENAARHSVSVLGRSGLVRDGEAIADPMDREVSALAVVNGAILGGFTPFWTFWAIVPWVRKTLDVRGPDEGPSSFETSGVGDAIVQSKWIFWRSDRPGGTTRLGVQGRVKAPVGSTDAELPSGDVAPRPLQVGTGSWDFEPTVLFTRVQGRWGVHGSAGWRFNGQDGGYEAGDAFSYNLAAGVRLTPGTYRSMSDQTVVAYLELNGQAGRKDRIEGLDDADSGGHVLFLSPDLQWVATPRLLFEGSVQVPVLQDLNGAQLEHETRFQLGTRYRFSLLR